VNAILNYPLFIESLRRTCEYEEDRDFCRHDIGHLIDVARLSYIFGMESGACIDKEVIYAAALLHDIGRWRQYEDGMPHAEASKRIAAKILPECGFSGVEAAEIQSAILSHSRKRGGDKQPGLAGILYRADKMSRRCFDCHVEDICDWKIKNVRLEY